MTIERVVIAEVEKGKIIIFVHPVLEAVIPWCGYFNRCCIKPSFCTLVRSKTQNIGLITHGGVTGVKGAHGVCFVQKFLGVMSAVFRYMVIVRPYNYLFACIF